LVNTFKGQSSSLCPLWDRTTHTLSLFIVSWICSKQHMLARKSLCFLHGKEEYIRTSINFYVHIWRHILVKAAYKLRGVHLGRKDKIIIWASSVESNSNVLIISLKFKLTNVKEGFFWELYLRYYPEHRIISTFS
jgi:hypothetical protein